jgi:phosphatidate cytidylyltransferase
MSKKISTLSNLSQRIIVGVLGAAVFIGSIIFSEWTYFLLFLGLTILGIDEFYRLVKVQGMIPQRIAGLTLGGLFYISSYQHLFSSWSLFWSFIAEELSLLQMLLLHFWGQYM